VKCVGQFHKLDQTSDILITVGVSKKDSSKTLGLPTYVGCLIRLH